MERLGDRWAAVFQGGPRSCLDGVASLEAAGLQRFDEPKIRVSVPRGARVRRTAAYDIRQTRRWSADDIVTVGIRRTRPAVAAVRAALWARTDRQAELVLVMAVQQRLAPVQQIAEQALRIRRDRRRLLVQAVVLELMGGVRSLSELDFARECRRRGIPEPTRHVVRKGKRGRYYLDVVWEQWKVVVEIDGIHHAWVENVVGDALRQNAVTLADAVVLRVPMLGLRTVPDAFFAQIADALRAAGCPDVIRTERPDARSA